MRVLTFGWEFPPAKNGGLGVACQGLTKELTSDGVEVLFVLPRQQDVARPKNTHFLFADLGAVGAVYEVPSAMQAYQSGATTLQFFDEVTKEWVRQGTVLDEVHRFARKAALIAGAEHFDLIHAHDWTSYLAGLAAKAVSGKPLIVHAHATSFDQAAGDNVDPSVYAIECKAFAEADRIVVVSDMNRQTLIHKHHVDPAKVVVVHNGCDPEIPQSLPPTLTTHKAAGKKIILYHGRITIQKGVDYFVQAARRVIDVEPDVLFVISGSGDMERQILQQVGGSGLGQHVLFAGALWDEERDQMYQSADLLVMPSVSEPFGLVPMEAIKHGTPALVSKQSGVSEVLTHVLKVDFWDVEEMADKMIAAIRHEPLNTQLVREGRLELLRHTWKKAASRIKSLYYQMIYLLK